MKQQESSGHEVSMTVKNGKVVLIWWAYSIDEDDWVGLYRNASDSDDKYIGGAWEWATKGYSYETNVDVTPGLQARYIKGKYKCLAKTDPFPAQDEAVKVEVFGAAKQEKKEEESVDESLYDKTPQELAEILRQKDVGECEDGGYSIYGKCMLGYKSGKFIIDWQMDSNEAYDWIALYKNSSAGINDYLTYQYVKRGAPYVTGTSVKEGMQIRYLTWSAAKKDYVEVVRSGDFKQLKVGSNSSAYPFKPSTQFYSAYRKVFPKLTQGNFTLTGAQTSKYNCIAWSLGFNDRWINPAENMEKFVSFYIQAGCEEKSSLTQSVAICAWALNGAPTHGSRRYQETSSLWESKLGPDYRATHGCNELEGNDYGKVVAYFTAPKKYTAQREAVGLTAEHYEELGMRVEQVPVEVREIFEEYFQELWEGWHSDAFRYESNTRKIRELPVYRKIMELGEEVLPLLVAKFADEQYFFALPLYDEMQNRGELRISYQDGQYEADVLEGEQQRAKRTARLYLEHKRN